MLSPTNIESVYKVDKYKGKLHELSINPKTQKNFLAQCEQMKQSDDEYDNFVAWTYFGEYKAKNKDVDSTKEAVKKLYEINEDGILAAEYGLSPMARIGEEKKALSEFRAKRKERASLLINFIKKAVEAETSKKMDLADEMKFNAIFSNYAEAYGKNEVAEARKVSPSKIWNDFNENEVAAEDEYKGHIQGVTGKISKITTSPRGYPEITFNIDQFGLKAVTFHFAKEARKAIAKLKRGKTITLGGECTGFFMGTIVVFEDAFIVDGQDLRQKVNAALKNLGAL